MFGVSEEEGESWERAGLGKGVSVGQGVEVVVVIR